MDNGEEQVPTGEEKVSGAGEETPGQEADSPPAGDQEESLFARQWKLLIPVVLVVGLAAALPAWWMFVRQPGPEDTGNRPVTEREVYGLAQSKIKRIHERRSRRLVDSLTRSKPNIRLASSIDSLALENLSSGRDLVIVATIYNNYVQTLILLFELGRLITNSYIPDLEKANILFQSTLMPKFRYAERRRHQLRSRVRNRRFESLLNNLDYIALHDSIAVTYMDSFLVKGRHNDFTQSLEFGYKAKLLTKDFWNQFQYYLDQYKVDYSQDEKVWRKYFGTWDQLEP
ncbi:MAG: hypothetical protein U9P14_02420 [Gemmatimonadota bacterium]|nr:hypothetical protein [Gemmatimonadota bacterium]